MANVADCSNVKVNKQYFLSQVNVIVLFIFDILSKD